MNKELEKSLNMPDTLDVKKYGEMWELAKPFLAKSRWWDLIHTEMSVGYLNQIMKGENKENLAHILIPAVILHDIGWSTIEKGKHLSWGEDEMRKRHMSEGAIIAEGILNQVDYNPDLTKQIVYLVSTHDNEYLGIKHKTDEEKLVRDADLCFVLTSLSFWKNFHVKSVLKGGGMTTTELLERYIENNSRRYTKTAQQITGKQIHERKTEILDISITPLQRYQDHKTKADEVIQDALS